VALRLSGFRPLIEKAFLVFLSLVVEEEGNLHFTGFVKSLGQANLSFGQLHESGFIQELARVFHSSQKKLVKFQLYEQTMKASFVSFFIQSLAKRAIETAVGAHPEQTLLILNDILILKERYLREFLEQICINRHNQPLLKAEQMQQLVQEATESTLAFFQSIALNIVDQYELRKSNQIVALIITDISDTNTTFGKQKVELLGAIRELAKASD